jgi:hypothetical protein
MNGECKYKPVNGDFWNTSTILRSEPQDVSLKEEMCEKRSYEQGMERRKENKERERKERERKTKILGIFQDLQTDLFDRKRESCLRTPLRTFDSKK